MPLLARSRLRLLEALLSTASRASARLRRSPALPPHLDLGRRGEEAAFFYLRRNGFVVVARRWRSSRARGDLDLIAWEGGTLCFVEVKTRSAHDFAPAETAVDEDKKRTLRRLARLYLRSLPTPSAETRFDILSVYFEKENAAEFELFRGAFDWY